MARNYSEQNYNKLSVGFMDTQKIRDLKSELANVRQEAVAAHIAGDRAKAECLTGKAVGIIWPFRRFGAIPERRKEDASRTIVRPGEAFLPTEWSEW